MSAVEVCIGLEGVLKRGSGCQGGTLKELRFEHGAHRPTPACIPFRLRKQQRSGNVGEGQYGSFWLGRVEELSQEMQGGKAHYALILSWGGFPHG